METLANKLGYSNKQVENAYEVQKKSILAQLGCEYVIYNVTENKIVTSINGKVTLTDNVNWVVTYKNEFNATSKMIAIKKQIKGELAVTTFEIAMKNIK